MDLGLLGHFAALRSIHSRFTVISADLKTIARALKPRAASLGFPVRKEPDMVAHPGGMRPRSAQLAAG